MSHCNRALSPIICWIAILANSVVTAQAPAASPTASSNLDAIAAQPVSAGVSQAIRPNSAINALNPQPLPPKERSVRVIKSMRETADLAPEAMVKINGRELTVKALREQIVVTKPEVRASSGAVFKFSSGETMAPINRSPALNDAAAGVRDKLDRYAGGSQGRLGSSGPAPTTPPPAPWVKHNLPKSRWIVVACGAASAPSGYDNTCVGADKAAAQTAMSSTQTLLVNGVSGGLTVFTTRYPATAHAGAFHTEYDASTFPRKGGVDVYELRLNPACRWEHWWNDIYSTATIVSSSPSPGVVRATANWKAQTCMSAKSTFFGALVDEDYACVTSYYNSKTTAECPAGVVP